MTLPTLLSKFASKSKARKEISYFICYWLIAKGTYESLQSNHEPNEIDTQMLCYEQSKTFDMKVKFAISGEKPGKTSVDEMAPTVRWLNFQIALDFAKTRQNINELETLEKFLYAYGKPANIEELLINASLVSDEQRYKILKKYA